MDRSQREQRSGDRFTVNVVLIGPGKTCRIPHIFPLLLCPRYAVTPLRRYAVGLPHHINLDHIVVRPVAQAANHKLIREA